MAKLKAPIDVAFAAGHGRRMMLHALAYRNRPRAQVESKTAARKREAREAKARRLAAAKARMGGE